MLSALAADAVARTPPGALAAAAGLGSGASMQAVAVDVSVDGASLLQPAMVVYFERPPLVTSIWPAAGSVLGGTLVSVYGSNFVRASGAPLCLFGGVPSTSVRVVSASMIVCAAPPTLVPSQLLAALFPVPLTVVARIDVSLSYARTVVPAQPVSSHLCLSSPQSPFELILCVCSRCLVLHLPTCRP